MLLSLGLGLWLVAAVAGAEAEQRIDIELMVSHISDAAGGVDERGEELHAKLQREFRYQSLKVLESRSLRLALDEVGTVTLPNGKRARIRPLQLGEHGVLLAVDVEGSVQTDLRVRNGHLVVIGAERYRDGKLVISLEPRW
jgi:hypothetical protein